MKERDKTIDHLRGLAILWVFAVICAGLSIAYFGLSKGDRILTGEDTFSDVHVLFDVYKSPAFTDTNSVICKIIVAGERSLPLRNVR